MSGGISINVSGNLALVAARVNTVFLHSFGRSLGVGESTVAHYISVGGGNTDNAFPGNAADSAAGTTEGPGTV